MAVSPIVSAPIALSGRYLTKRELAHFYGVSIRWIEYQLAKGMPSRLIGHQRRFLLTEVDGWLEDPHPTQQRLF